MITLELATLTSLKPYLIYAIQCLHSKKAANLVSKHIVSRCVDAIVYFLVAKKERS